jgi:hypothetical protein
MLDDITLISHGDFLGMSAVARNVPVCGGIQQWHGAITLLSHGDACVTSVVTRVLCCSKIAEAEAVVSVNERVLCGGHTWCRRAVAYSSGMGLLTSCLLLLLCCLML